MKRLQKALDRIRQLVSSRKFAGARHGADGGERVDESQAEVGAVSSAELDEEVTRGLLRAEVGADGSQAVAAFGQEQEQQQEQEEEQEKEQQQQQQKEQEQEVRPSL